MPKLRSITTLLALLGSWAPLHAQDLLTVYELALENDAQLQIAEANYLCNDLGLDTISTGNTIGCAMELAEKGHLAGDLGFGQADKLLGLIHDTAYRQGIGAELADGSYRWATKHGAPELSMSVKKRRILDF